MSYQLRFYPYSGSSYVLVEGDKEECRARAARKIRYHRNRLEYPVLIMDRGEKWELESDPEGCSMIGDGEGILALKEVDEPEVEDDDWDEDELVTCCMECGNTIDFDEELCEECWSMNEEEDEDAE